MTVVNLVIKNARIITSHGTLDAGIAIDAGKIVCIAKDENLPKSDKVINAENKLVLPGFIDMHVHFRDPGYTYKEDFSTGTMGAAAGGITFVVDHANCKPQTTTVQRFQEKRAMAEKKAVVDFGLWAGPKLDEVQPLANAGAMGYKIFMSYPNRDDQTELSIFDDDLLLAAFKAMAPTGLPIVVHVDNHKITESIRKELRDAGKKDLGSRLEYERKIAVGKDEGVCRVILLAQETNARVHVAHIYTKRSIEIVRLAKTLGVKASCEVMPLRLFITMKDCENLGPYVYPWPSDQPFFKETLEEIWEGIEDGTIDAFATDHAPHSKAEKEVGRDDPFKYLTGSPQLEYVVSLLLTLVNEGRLSMESLIRMYSESPAKLLGVYPQKGAIQVGSDADLTIVDMKKNDVIKPRYTKCGWVPFEGRRTKGAPVYTIARGELVMEQGEVVGKPGRGKFISPNSGCHTFP